MNAAVAIPFFVALQHNDAQAEVGADLARPAAGRGTDGRRSAVAGTIPDLVLITLVSVPRSTNMHFETPLEFLESRTYDEINLGDTSSLIRTLRPEDVKLFALMSGDMNPALANAEFRHSGLFQDFIAHGMWTASLMSTTLGTQFPGPGTVLIESTVHFARPVTIGDTITVTVTVKQKFDHNHHIILDCACFNQDDLLVVSGRAEVLAPATKIRTKRTTMPEITISDKYARLQVLVKRAEGLAPIDMAVVHPCDSESLKGALLAAEANLIDPILIGPEQKIRSVAEENHFDLGQHRIVNVRHSHEAAAMAVTLIRNGDAEALMKGSLHTDELMAEVIASRTGLRTDRRISHVFLMDVPTYPRPVMITDAAVNILPTLMEKVDIIQNAIDLAHIIGTPEPKVAILSAVETVNPKIQSTLDAAALCKMADRGQIKRRAARRSAGFRQRHLAGRRQDQGHPSRRWPAAPTSSSSPTSNPATCSPSSSNTSAMP
jgi:phosphate acetyltransferase